MKKRIILLTLFITILCVGCSFTSKETEEKLAQDIEQKTETIVIEQNKEDILKEIIDNEVSITETTTDINNIDEITLDNLTKDILLSMSLEELKAFVEKYIPNYREIYLIEADKILTDDDWESLRQLIALKLFGSSIPDSVIEEIEAYDINQEANMETIKQDENSIYYAPSIYDIESMSLKVFAEYLNGMYEYYRGVDENADFTQLDNESLQTLKDQYIESLKSQKSEYIEGSIEMMTGNEAVSE